MGAQTSMTLLDLNNLPARIVGLLREQPELTDAQMIAVLKQEFRMTPFDEFFVEGLIHGARKMEK